MNKHIFLVQVVCEAATGHIYRLPGENQFDVEQYRLFMDQLHQLGKVFIMLEQEVWKTVLLVLLTVCLKGKIIGTLPPSPLPESSLALYTFSRINLAFC